MKYQRNRISVSLSEKILKAVLWLQKLPEKLTPPPFRLLQLGSAFWQSRVLYTAAQLDIASQLKDSAMSIAELARSVDVAPDSLNRLMNMLSAMGIFHQEPNGEVRNNRLSSYLRRDNPRNVRAMILMHNSDEMSRPWYRHLEQGIRENKPPFKLANGSELFSYMSRHPAFDELFSHAMSSVEALGSDSFVSDFKWSRFSRIFDLGGSSGSKSRAILQQHPQLEAVVVDRPELIRQQQAQTCPPNLSFQAGDLLKEVPASQDTRDIYLLCAVLHAFNDSDCIRILRNIARASVDTGARVAIMELVMPEQNADLTHCAFDMQMFIGTSGRERTLQQWQSIFYHAGYKLEESVRLRPFGHIMVLKSRLYMAKKMAKKAAA